MYDILLLNIHIMYMYNDMQIEHKKSIVKFSPKVQGDMICKKLPGMQCLNFKLLYAKPELCIGGKIKNGKYK